MWDDCSAAYDLPVSVRKPQETLLTGAVIHFVFKLLCFAAVPSTCCYSTSVNTLIMQQQHSKHLLLAVMYVYLRAITYLMHTSLGKTW